MTEFLRVEHATITPTCCFLCGASDQPMVSTGFELPNVPTEAGIMSIDAHVYICIGTEQNPGCCVQLGRFADMVDGPIYREAQVVIVAQEGVIEMLRARINELEANAVHVVTIEDARELVAAGKVTVPARPRGWDE